MALNSDRFPLPWGTSDGALALKRASYTVPSSSGCDVPGHHPSDSECVTERGVGFSRSCSGAQGANLVLSQLCCGVTLAVQAVSELAHRMSRVFSACDNLQVFWSVVLLVSVLMVDHQAFGDGADECFVHQTVNQEASGSRSLSDLLPCFIQRNAEFPIYDSGTSKRKSDSAVPIACITQSEDLPLSCSSPPNLKSNISLIRHRVEGLVSDHRSPSFSHGGDLRLYGSLGPTKL